MLGQKHLENGWRDFIMEDKGLPYFMENDEWFYYDEEEEIFKLTDKAPEKARESYKEFYGTEDVIM